MKQFQTLEGSGRPVHDYSTIAEVTDSRLIFIAGQVPWNEVGESVGIGNPEEQIRQVFRNLDAAVRAAGGTLNDLVRITVYLTDSRFFPAFRKVRPEFLKPPYPTSTGIVVTALGYPEWIVEIDAVAALERTT
ncbi:MAG: RidA family protein [Pseudaminobacter sp.]